ncbi:hypothetical protein [Rhizobium lentis]|uniref:hypothetical protein n=1 Tax=Rhizobium lentis TaxID=1138194 RepID=UPI001C82F6F9|nr:hypothetical protein [Rhizobium lentis]MBX5050750.1 hypothetical protein [Rhizobium lentis]MBX5062764.1 hypothetical protein [Rhizobium lentis]
MKRTNLEKLKLVFTLAPGSGKKTVIAEKPRIEVGERRYGALTAIDAMRIIIEVLRKLQLNDIFRIDGTAIELTRLLTSVEKIDRLREVETSSLIFSYGAVADCDHCFLKIEETSAGASVDWDLWVAPFLVSPHFVQAWVADVEYDKWQNAEDLIIYKAANRDYSALPMRSNGLPPPLQQMVVDISHNPGRWLLRSGYVEAVGSVMWLSDIFWSYVGRRNKERLSTVTPIEIRQVTENVIRVCVSESTFTEASSPEVQDRLREVLYGR